jgi:hypothetical protein
VYVSTNACAFFSGFCPHDESSAAMPVAHSRNAALRVGFHGSSGERDKGRLQYYGHGATMLADCTAESRPAALAIISAMTNARMLTNDKHRSEPVTSFDARELTFDFPGLAIGVAEYAEGPTGCTVLHFHAGAPVSPMCAAERPARFSRTVKDGSTPSVWRADRCTDWRRRRA